MVRTITRASLLGLAGTLMTMTLVVAQQPGMSGHMSMGSMMQECRTHHQEMTTSIDHMMTMMSQAQQSLAAMKDHMGSCMNMMSMMEQMQGGMGSQMPQQKK